MINDILHILDKLYPEPKCELNYNSDINFLVAVILSGQCTDKRVNIVMTDIMKKYVTALDYANIDISELENDIRSVGLYRAKAKNIKQACTLIHQKYGGKLPNNMEQLLMLPGVGRKTANVVLGEIFGVAGIVVDTHVKRITKRLGLTQSTNPEIIEKQLLKIIPTHQQQRFCHQIILHGRAVCKAVKPLCCDCALYFLCESAN